MEQTVAARAEVRDERTAIHPMLRLVLPATRENLGTIRGQASAFLSSQLGERLRNFPLDEVMLALQEACSNVVRHAYHGVAPGPIFVSIDLTPRLARFCVADEGQGYDPGQVPAPDAANPRDGGFGLHLMRQTMSRVSYRRSNGRNELVLDKALRDPDRVRETA